MKADVIMGCFTIDVIDEDMNQKLNGHLDKTPQVAD